MSRLLALISLPLLVAVGCQAQEVAPLVLSSCDNAADWTGGTADTKYVKEGQASLKWEHGKADRIGLKSVPKDWSAYDRLSFWLYSEKATGSRFLVLLPSENPASEGMDYYSGSVTVNFTGWKRIRLYLPRLGASREPLGWNQIEGLTLTASGWGNEPNPETIVWIDDVTLTKEGKDRGPRMTDEELFEGLNLDYPGLEKTAAAYRAGDLVAAKHELAEYYRHREKPVWWFPAGQKADPKPENPDLTGAEKVLKHELRSIGISYQFGPEIDWNFDVTTAPGSTYAPNNEWTWQLNRHPHWATLARTYYNTGDERYAREFVAQMTQWVRDCPLPEDAANGARSAWRTIETGIRSSGVLWECFYRFLLSPEMTDEALVTYVKSIAEHAQHLMSFHTGGNWLTMEGNGLFTIGVMLPEFKAAEQWRQAALGWLYSEMNIQVYPDGVQVELSSGYHHVSLSNFLGAFKMAQLNQVPLPEDYLKRLEKMYDFDVYAAAPDRKIPGVQDGGYTDVRGTLRTAAGLFPERKDFLWYATDGKEGEPPATTSHVFDYAGYYILRSGWDSDATYMLFDGGPFGYGHQHEDKLNMVVHAYGKLLLVDPGNYQYERSKWRSYFIDSPSHNVTLVDGEPQRRRGQSRDNYLSKEPLTNPWVTTPEYDYVEASFTDGFGGEVKTGVTQTRRVLFVKPGYWVVLDTFVATDGREHSYDTMFHLDAPVQLTADKVRLFTGNEDAANLCIAARPDAGLSLKIVEGQEDPVQGWLPNSGLQSVRKAPVGIFTIKGTGTTHVLYALVPAKAGQADLVASVEALGTTGLGARIRFTDGSESQVVFAESGPAKLQIGDATATARALLVEKQADGTAGRTIIAAP